MHFNCDDVIASSLGFPNISFSGACSKNSTLNSKTLEALCYLAQLSPPTFSVNLPIAGFLELFI